MICLIALVVFGILGLFSATHRAYAKEAFDCVFRRVTLRKCNTGFDKKMKSKITGKLLRRSPRAAKIVYRHFEAISWFFTILMIVSFAYSADGLYKWYVYGNCNGENSNGFCVFNSLGGNAPTITISEIPLDEFPSFGQKDAPIQIVEFGCFQCQYTMKAESEMQKIREKHPDDVRITFVYAPVPHHYNAMRAAEAAACAYAEDENKYWQYHEALFYNQHAFNNSVKTEEVLNVLESLAKNTGFSKSFDECLAEGKAADIVQKGSDYAINIGITATPTFYLNGKKLSKSLTLEDVEKALKEQTP